MENENLFNLSLYVSDCPQVQMLGSTFIWAGGGGESFLSTLTEVRNWNEMKNLPVWPPRNIRTHSTRSPPFERNIDQMLRVWFSFSPWRNVLRIFPICIGETMAIPPVTTIFIFRRLVLWWETERIDIKPWRCWAMEKRKEERVAANRFDRRHNRAEIRSRGMSCQNRRGEEKKRNVNRTRGRTAELYGNIKKRFWWTRIGIHHTHFRHNNRCCKRIKHEARNGKEGK
jgi:hypothetical protein